MKQLRSCLFICSLAMLLSILGCVATKVQPPQPPPNVLPVSMHLPPPEVVTIPSGIIEALTTGREPNSEPGALPQPKPLTDAPVPFASTPSTIITFIVGGRRCTNCVNPATNLYLRWTGIELDAPTNLDGKPHLYSFGYSTNFGRGHAQFWTNLAPAITPSNGLAIKIGNVTNRFNVFVDKW